ncbi:flagellar biosynthesis anti-sigma factor FlgM [Thermopirellula anaerolimosa]
MQIHGPSHIHGAQPLHGPHGRVARPEAVANASPIQDELQLSDAAQLLDKVHDLPDVRWDRIARIKAEIANGSYETEEKLQIAVERLLDEIG